MQQTPSMPPLSRSLSSRSITKLKSLRSRLMPRNMLSRKALSAIFGVILLYFVFLHINSQQYSDTSTNLLGNTLSYLSGSAILTPKAPDSQISSDVLAEGLLSGSPEIVKPAEFKDYVSEYGPDDLRTRLAAKFHYSRDTEIPHNIWQTWSKPLEKITDEKLKKVINSWTNQEKYSHNLITDDQIELFIFENYSEFPEIMETYNTLPLEILKLDFFRYLVLFAEGGIYTDIDTLNIVEASKWIDSPEVIESFFGRNTTSTQVGFMIGIEGDYDKPDWKYKVSRRLQFVQWTIKAKKGHPILRELINTIVTVTLNNYSERLNHVKIRDEYFTLHSVYTILEWTGPAIFTDSIFDHLNRIYDQMEIKTEHGLKYINENPTPEIKHFEFGEHNQIRYKDINQFDDSSNRFIGWNNFTKITKPVLYDDVVILPINSFNGFVDDLEYPVNNKLTYIKHEFHGSWKNFNT